MSVIRKGDRVKVICGKDRGKSGRVLRSFPKEKRVMVEGINEKTKHSRSKKQGQKGQITHISAPIHESNVLLVCPNCGKASRIAVKKEESGVKLRVCKKCKKEF